VDELTGRSKQRPTLHSLTLAATTNRSSNPDRSAQVLIAVKFTHWDRIRRELSSSNELAES
jgi:hypothetical protein